MPNCDSNCYVHDEFSMAKALPRASRSLLMFFGPFLRLLKVPSKKAREWHRAPGKTYIIVSRRQIKLRYRAKGGFCYSKEDRCPLLFTFESLRRRVTEASTMVTETSSYAMNLREF